MRRIPSLFGLRPSPFLCWLAGIFFLVGVAKAAPPVGNFDTGRVNPVDEAYLVTPQGHDKPGKLLVPKGDNVGRLRVTVRDRANGEPTCCRVNVVGPDGNFYQPQDNRLGPYGFTGNWPDGGARANRLAKGPIRYYGWFFYTTGQFQVDVPAGVVRVEVWKGMQYRPQVLLTRVDAHGERHVEVTLVQTLPMAEMGYYAGDPHLHVPRRNEADNELALDLMQAEGILYGSILCYNEPPGPYTGAMDRLDMPQLFGLGAASLRSRGDYAIISGLEYRSSTYGHLNLYFRDNLVLNGETVNADNYPIYGQLARQTREAGGFAFYAHGGYALAVYADAIQQAVDGVELLQFGMYRGMGLEDWYHILNTGLRFPAVGASDYPACRKLGDSMTFIHHPKRPDFAAWYRGMARGESFVTTGPMLFLEVDGHKPGHSIYATGAGPHRVTARVRVVSEVAPFSHVQLIVNGKAFDELVVPAGQERGQELVLERLLELQLSSWIAARAFARAPSGSADVEAHTNPVYVYVDGRAPYQRESLDAILKELDRQIAYHQSRDFEQRTEVVNYFLKSRDRLLAIREANGLEAPDSAATSGTPGVDGSVGASVKASEGKPEALEEFLRRVPPKSPEEALAAFETVGGFRMELVACEPLVHDPVAAAFDENGRLYVAELADYPYQPKPGAKPLGQVRLLEDTNGDGRFDESYVFADELLWAAGVAPWKGGVFVCAPPDIWYLKDTDGDRKADVRQKIFTGFGTQNQQGMLNNLQWGLDHRIYGSTSVNGGEVRRADKPEAEPISVHGHDFCFDPASGRFEPISGTLQFGNTFDDWGNRFVCSESQPLKHVVMPQHYLARNPYLPVSNAIESLAEVPTPVFRTSPIEAWREIRSRRRIAGNIRPATSPGVSHHVIDAAAGVTVYRGGAYPPEYYGNVFVGDAQNNLIHRRVLHERGVAFTSERADQQTEFVRSTDNWFRPVNFVNAPDGTLYMLDLSREILESVHIPLDVVERLDLRSGRDRGRIYRIAPPNFSFPAPPKLGSASTAELVAALEHPNSWWRDTAHRLIYERGDPAATMPLRRMLAESRMPQARLHALWSLEGLGVIEQDDLALALGDPAAAVREHAIRLAEPRLEQMPQLTDRVLACADDPHARVRFQLALTLGEMRDPRAVALLADYAEKYSDDPWMRTALLSSIGGSPDSVFAALAEETLFAGTPAGKEMLRQLALLVGVRHDRQAVERVLDVLAALPGDNALRLLETRIVLALGEGLKRAGARFSDSEISSPPAKQFVTALITQAQATARDDQADSERRRQAIELLGCTELTLSRGILAGLLDNRQPPAVQLAALDALAGYAESDIAQLVLRNWSQYSPDVRSGAIRLLLSREAWTIVMLEAAQAGAADVAQLDLTQRAFVVEHGNAAIRKLAGQLLAGAQGAARSEVVARYQPALALPGDITRGEKTFEQHCMACHQIGSRGHDVGPQLASTVSLDSQALLMNILDPNQHLLPKYVQYVVIDVAGRIYTGMIAQQTATSIRLVRDQGQADVILRASIDEMTATGKSLMPEGFEQKVSPQDMTDLIAYLKDARERHGPAPDSEEKSRRDFGTLPGLVEPD